MTGKSANWVLGEPKDGAWDVNIVWSGSGFLDNIIDWGVGVVMVDHVILCHVALLDLPHVHRSILSGARQKSPVHTKPDGPYGAAMGLDLLAQVHRRELLLALPALPRFDPLRRHHAMVLLVDETADGVCDAFNPALDKSHAPSLAPPEALVQDRVGIDGIRFLSAAGDGGGPGATATHLMAAHELLHDRRVTHTLLELLHRQLLPRLQIAQAVPRSVFTALLHHELVPRVQVLYQEQRTHRRLRRRARLILCRRRRV